VGKIFVAGASNEPPPEAVEANNADWLCAGLVSIFDNPATEINELRTNLLRSMSLLLCDLLTSPLQRVINLHPTGFQHKRAKLFGQCLPVRR
jgi:hypothetical protein